MSALPVLAIIPARGGSKGIPGKNLRPLCGLPLVAHSIACARSVDTVSRVIVSTDSEQIADVALKYGAEAPFLRPPDLAGDDAGMWPVVQHALLRAEAEEGRRYGSVLLLPPTSPLRDLADLDALVEMLEVDATLDGAVTVSVPRFNPLWVCVVEEQGIMRDFFAGGSDYVRRQDVPQVFRINGVAYVWRRDFVTQAKNWRDGRIGMRQISERTAVDIDDLDDFRVAEHMLAAGLARVPWISEEGCAQSMI